MKKQWKKEFEDSIKRKKTAEAFHDNSAAQWTAEMNHTLIKTSEAAVDLAKKTKKMAIQTEQTVQDMAKRTEAAAAKSE